jgi:hypothetical protein
VNNHFDFGHQVHGQTNMNGKFTKIADGLHIDLRLLDFKTGLFLNGIRYILRSDGAIQFASFTGFGSKDQSQSTLISGLKDVFYFLRGSRVRPLFIAGSPLSYLASSTAPRRRGRAYVLFRPLRVPAAPSASPSLGMRAVSALRHLHPHPPSRTHVLDRSLGRVHLTLHSSRYRPSARSASRRTRRFRFFPHAPFPASPPAAPADRGQPDTRTPESYSARSARRSRRGRATASVPPAAHTPPPPPADPPIGMASARHGCAGRPLLCVYGEAAGANTRPTPTYPPHPPPPPPPLSPPPPFLD